MRILPTLCLATAVAGSASTPMSAPVHLPAAAARLVGATTRAATRPGHAAGGYVTNFVGPNDAVLARFPADAGVYDVRLRYCSPTGHKGVTVRANGISAELMFPQTGQSWTTFDAGRVELIDGENALSVGGGWGHYDIDRIDLTPAFVVPPHRPTGDLCDPSATPAARRLMRRLLAGYGSVTLSGGYGDREEGYVAAHADGRRPAIYGADLMDFSPSRVAHGADPRGIVDGILRHAAAGQAVTVSWHWNAPAGLLDTVRKHPDGTSEDLRWYRGFRSDATTFDVAAALAHPASPEYQLLLRDIDAIAVPLQRLADANVPVLWRPLHEAEGAWFWWGAKGPDPFVALWRLAYDRLTRVHGLHNLLWVYSCTTLGDRRWYPGDDCMDVVGVDAYPSDNRDTLGQMWSNWSAIAPAKPLAVSEFGGVPDVGRMHRLGYPWLYFVSWAEPQGPASTGPAELGRRYGDGHLADLSRWQKTQ